MVGRTVVVGIVEEDIVVEEIVVHEVAHPRTGLEEVRHSFDL